MFCNHIHEAVQCRHYNPTPPPFITSAQCRSLPGPCAHCSPSFLMLHTHNANLPTRRELWCVCMTTASSPRSNTNGRKSKIVQCGVHRDKWCSSNIIIIVFPGLSLTGWPVCCDVCSAESVKTTMKISASNEFWILEVFITRWVRSLFFFFHFCLTVKLWKSFNGYKTLPNFPMAWACNPIARVNVS